MLTSAKVCPLCGFDDCETVTESLVAEEYSVRDNQLMPTAASDQGKQIDDAAALLAKSTSPLICGLDCLDSAAQMAAWRLADQIHGIVDSTLVGSGRAAIESLQRHGKVTATYGEIRNRSDLLVFWDCDLQTKHSCLLRLLVSNRVPDRKIVFVGSPGSPMAQVADFVFEVDAAEDRNPMVRLICRLRAMVAGRALLGDQYSDRDMPAAKVQELFSALQQASYGSLFYSSHESDWEFDLETESLFQLVSEFNSISPMVCIGVRDDANGLGAETVMSLASGFPAAINLQRGQASSCGSLYSASEVLRRSNCDTILLCGNADGNGSGPVPEWMNSRLGQVTVIQLATRPETFTDMFIPCPTLEFGKAFAGNVFRGDGVMLSSSFPGGERSAETVLNSLAVAYQNILTK